MPFADDPLEQAYDLAHKEATNSKQASLRRAVSTAYYALFHLLIDEAVSKWAVERQRSILARTFEHSKMKAICDDVLKTVKSGGDLPPAAYTSPHKLPKTQPHPAPAERHHSQQRSRTRGSTRPDLSN